MPRKQEIVIFNYHYETNKDVPPVDPTDLVNYKCVNCQRNRLKCNKVRGGCDKCLRRNIQCGYNNKPPRTHKPKDKKLVSMLSKFAIIPKCKDSNEKTFSSPATEVSGTFDQTYDPPVRSDNLIQKNLDIRHSISFLLS